MDPTQDIQEPEPSEPKDTLVAAIHAIKALTLPMMDTGCCQMRDPPHGQLLLKKCLGESPAALAPTESRACVLG